MISNEVDSARDVKNKAFVTQIEKSLKAFEYSNEWADLISALARLIKVIQTNVKAGYIPRGFLVGKRLAQCLHPALPSGVHCKALECYDIIFRTMEPDSLITNLPLYGPGLFTLLESSAMAVKPPLFDIYEQHFLPLGKIVSPAFSGLLQGLLPALEAGSEFFERGNRLLEMFSLAVGPSYFYTCLWKLMIRALSIRQFGISFIVSHYNKRKPLQQQSYLYGSDKHVLLNSLYSLFGDQVLLVQRDTLDFLLLTLPLHINSIKQCGPQFVHFKFQLNNSNLVLICTAALTVLLRRDASLNRRFFNWLKGAQPVDGSSELSWAKYLWKQMINDTQTSATNSADEPDDEQLIGLYYFKTYSKHILIQSIRQLISDPGCLPIPVTGTGTPSATQSIAMNLTTSTNKANNESIWVHERSLYERPFRLMTGILDHADIAGEILTDLLLDLMCYTYRCAYKLGGHSKSPSSSSSSTSTIVQSDLVRTVEQNNQHGQILPANMLRLMHEYILVRNNTKSYDMRSTEQFSDTKSTVNNLNESNVEQTTTQLTTNQIPTSLNQSETDHFRTKSADTQQQHNFVDEYFRTVHLFFSNIDGEFLWNFIQTQFTKLFNSVDYQFKTESGQNLTLIKWCHILQCLLSHLSLDTYPNVCNYYLPKLILHLLNFVCDALRQVPISTDDENVSTTSRRQLDLSEVNSLLNLISLIVNYITQYAITMLDHLSSPVNVKQYAGVTERQFVPLYHISEAEEQLMLIASVVGQIRELLGVFFINVLKFPQEKLHKFIQLIQIHHHYDHQRCAKIANRLFRVPQCMDLWLDPLAEICYLLIQLTSCPLIIKHNIRNVDGVIENDVKFRQIVNLFFGDLIHDLKQDQFVLPTWMVCLLFAATVVSDNFNLKSITFYTVLELFHASLTINGWHCETAMNSSGNVTLNSTPRSTSSASFIDVSNSETDPVNDGVRLAFPVLDAKLMRYLCTETNIFTLLGISLWDYLSAHHAPYHEDVTNLLLYLHQLCTANNTDRHHHQSVEGPTNCPTITTTRRELLHRNLENFILSQMLSNNLQNRVDATDRFIRLWHLLRCPPTLPPPTVIPSSHKQSMMMMSNNSQQSDSLHNFSRTNSIGHKQNINTNSDNSNTNNQKGQQTQLDRLANLIIASPWRHAFLRQTNSKLSDWRYNRNCTPFYRCTLLLLDNLDFDNPWGPISATSIPNWLVSLSSAPSSSSSSIEPTAILTDMPNIQSQTNHHHHNNLIHMILRQQSIGWIEKSLLTNQLDRWIVPVLAVLLHPSTARISLKSFVLSRYAEQITPFDKQMKSDQMTVDQSVKSKFQDVTNLRHSLQIEPIIQDISSVTTRTANLIDSIQAKFQRRRSSENRNPKEAVNVELMKQKTAKAASSASINKSDNHTNSSSFNLLPINEHLLIYLQNYDANQVIYAFSRLRAVLTIYPNLFIRSLANCSVLSQSNFNLFGLQHISNLIGRHRRSLIGRNFYHMTSPDEYIFAQSLYSNLLELLIDLCLQFMCSYLPCLSTDQLISNLDEYWSNLYVQNMAAQLLELIVKQLVSFYEEAINSTPFVDSNSQSITGTTATLPTTTTSNIDIDISESGPLYPGQLDTKTIEHIFNHTYLHSIVLHCLTSTVLQSHLDINCTESMSSCGRSARGVRDDYFDVISTLPTCLRVILSNTYLANLPDTFNTTHLQTLLRLMKYILKIKSWWHDTSDLINCSPSIKNMDKSVLPNCVWPIYQIPDQINNDYLDYNTNHSSSVLLIWSKAYNCLPKHLSTQTIFRLNCLTLHKSNRTMLTDYQLGKCQADLFVELLHWALTAGGAGAGAGDTCPLTTMTVSNVRQIKFVARLDLQFYWFQFIFNSLSYWDWFVSGYLRCVVSQLCANLYSLAQRTLDAVHNCDDEMLITEEDSEFARLPPDYSLQVLGLLQAICHAFLLTNLTDRHTVSNSRKALQLRSNLRSRQGQLFTSQLIGLPHTIERVSFIKETLEHYSQQQPTITGTVGASATTPVGADLSQSTCGLPLSVPLSSSPCGDRQNASDFTMFDATGTNTNSTINSTTNNGATATSSTIGSQEASLILNKRLPNATSDDILLLNGVDVGEKKELQIVESINTPGSLTNSSTTGTSSITAVYLPRPKVQSIQTRDDQVTCKPSHPFIQAQAELFALLPTVLDSLALVWYSLNELSKFRLGDEQMKLHSDDSLNDSDYVRDNITLLKPGCFGKTSQLTCLGSVEFVRAAIRRLLRPLAMQHPFLLLITKAVAWPNTLLDAETGGLSADSGNYSTVIAPIELLQPQRISERGHYQSDCRNLLPLDQRQCNLLDLFLGYMIEPTLRQDIGTTSQVNAKYCEPLIPATVLINSLRNSIPRPSLNQFVFTAILSGLTVNNTLTDLWNNNNNNNNNSNQSKVGTNLRSSTNNLHTQIDNGLNLIRVQINLLHLFYAWLTAVPDFVSPDLLLNLIRDLVNIPVVTNLQTMLTNSSQNTVTNSLCPTGMFILLKIFNHFLNISSTNDDRREQKEIQELCHRILEAMATIAASALQQASWFRRTLQVRQPASDDTTQNQSSDSQFLTQHHLSATGESNLNGIATCPIPLSTAAGSVTPLHGSATDLHITMSKSTNSSSSMSLNTNTSVAQTVQLQQTNNKSTNQYTRAIGHKSSNQCVPNCISNGNNELNRLRFRNDVTIQAIELLSNHMANFLDLVYRNDEKDRVATFLMNILMNIFPFLRARTANNSDHFTMASKLLYSISSYQYTRRAWRREVLDFLFETNFFQMSPLAIQSWNGIVDNLMTQDKNTFKEALTRLVFSQPGGLSLFTNKEAEYELRANCLKKLAYIVYASEPDQYAKSVPDLLERLTECLRLGQGIIPIVHTQVFVFARVLISRMSSVQLNSLWPIVIPELFLTLKVFSYSIKEYISKHKTNKTTSKINVQSIFSNVYLNLFLSSFKFLSTCLLCPESRVPQFLFYQWTFVSDFINTHVNGLLKSRPGTNLDNTNCNGNYRHQADENVVDGDDDNEINLSDSHFIPLLSDILLNFQELADYDKIASHLSVNCCRSENNSSLYGCLNLLAFDKISNIMELYPFLYSLNQNWDTEMRLGAARDPLLSNDHLLNLVLEAALAQEFPEPFTTGR